MTKLYDISQEGIHSYIYRNYDDNWANWGYAATQIQRAKDIGVSEDALAIAQSTSESKRGNRTVDEYAKELYRNAQLYGRYMGDEDVTFLDKLYVYLFRR